MCAKAQQPTGQSRCAGGSVPRRTTPLPKPGPGRRALAAFAKCFSERHPRRLRAERGPVAARNETITGMQIRAARGFLAWDRRDLAKNSVVTLYTIERLETGAEISGAAMTKGLAAVDIREPCGGEARFSWVFDNNRSSIDAQRRGRPVQALRTDGHRERRWWQIYETVTCLACGGITYQSNYRQGAGRRH